MTKYTLQNVTSEMLSELKKGSAFTIEGAGGDLNEWCKGLNKMLKERNIGQVKAFYTWTGTQMNNKYHLKNSNRYPDDFTFLAFKLDGLDCMKLAMFKLEFGARWLDDIVDNNAIREKEQNHD